MMATSSKSVVRITLASMNLEQVTCVLITRHKQYPQEITLDGFGEILIVPNSPNVFQRYVTATQAMHDVIYVQDDDCIVDYKELFGHYNGQLTNSMTEHHQRAYQGSGATLVGWGCFFPKKALRVFTKYLDRYGKDFHLLREADRIFTYLNQPHNTVIMPHQDLAQTPDRMSFEPMHYEWAKQAIAKCRVL